MTKFYFGGLPLHAESLFSKAVRGGIFFHGNCNVFHRVSTKYSLNNNILNFKKILCVGFSCRGHP